MSKETITIVIEDGMVQAVLGIPGIRVVVVDYDVSGSDFGDVKMIAQVGSEPEPAFVSEFMTEQNPIIEESALQALESN